MTASLRVYELRGPAAGEALDWLHVHADVQGVVEGDDAITLWLTTALPALPPFDVSVRELAAPTGPAITGTENDRAILVADDLLVRPPWVAAPAGFQGIELVVPRGGAFGSGEHGSTQAALRCLHAMWDQPASFADIGCGSGILALYARVRGCERIEACDIDGPSVAAAAELLPAARVHLGGAELCAPCEGVVANMTAVELTSSLSAIRRVWTGRALLVLSGLRSHEVEPMVKLVGLPVMYRVSVGDFTALGYGRTSAINGGA
jgi:hypothetical protein